MLKGQLPEPDPGLSGGAGGGERGKTGGGGWIPDICRPLLRAQLAVKRVWQRGGVANSCQLRAVGA